ncbi:KTSC domain-containing protein [Devosia sp.]|uniref:KTSC domain-containing protein n=1 Tax=Devosia sp. TaxID=1871048 RepID=UPI002FC6C01A
MVWFDSTAILRAEYEPETATLQLWFRESGGPYDYRNVPADIFDGLCDASSKGRYYNEHIRDRYEVIPPAPPR